MGQNLEAAALEDRQALLGQVAVLEDAAGEGNAGKTGVGAHKEAGFGDEVRQGVVESGADIRDRDAGKQVVDDRP